MTGELAPARSEQRGMSPLRFRIGHLVLAVAFAAIAMWDILNYGRREPFLIGLAAAGFGAYGVTCWLGWCYAQRFVARLGRVRLVVTYAAAAAAFFLVATVIYLLAEYYYLVGSF